MPMGYHVMEREIPPPLSDRAIREGLPASWDDWLGPVAPPDPVQAELAALRAEVQELRDALMPRPSGLIVGALAARVFARLPR